MKLIIKKGTTSKRSVVFVQDSTVTNNVAGLTGLAFNSPSLVWYYWREDTGNAGGVAVTLATATRGTWSTGGFKEIDATNLPGMYELGLPDAILATGASWAIMMLKGAASMVPVTVEFQLVSYDPDDAVRLGLTSLPNVVAGQNGGLPLGDANSRVQVQPGTSPGQVSMASGIVDVNLKQVLTVAVTATSNLLDVNTKTITGGLLSLKRNTSQAISFFLSNSAGAAVTGLGAAVTVTRSIDGASFAACPNAVSEQAGGYYTLVLAAGDLNGTWISFLITGAGAVPTAFSVITQA